MLPSCEFAVRRCSGVFVLSSCDLDLTVSLACLCCQVATSPLLRSASAAKLRPRRFSGVLVLPSFDLDQDLAVFLQCFGPPSCDLAVSPLSLCISAQASRRLIGIFASVSPAWTRIRRSPGSASIVLHQEPFSVCCQRLGLRPPSPGTRFYSSPTSYTWD